MKQRSRAQIRLILIAFAALLLLLALLLWQGIRRGDAVRVGVPRSASAYGAVLLLQTPSAQYHCVLGSTAQVLARALEAGELDAALLPCDTAKSLADCEIRAVLGAAPLVVVSKDGELTLKALEGQTLTLEKNLQGTREEAMLTAVLREKKIGCKIVYGKTGDPFACSLDGAAALLQENADWQICFSVGEAWEKAMSSLPPAGLCLTVRREYLERAGADYSAFERALQSSVQYGGEKRKKTVAMAAAAGLAAGEEIADRLYPYVDFAWLTGEDAAQSLRAAP